MKKQYLLIKLLTLLFSITANAQFVNSGQNLANKSRDVLMLDVDNDNDLDLIFGKSDNTPGSDRNVVWLNDGNGNYSFSQAITTNTLNNLERTFDIDAADINNDNFPEFYSANGEGGLLNDNSNGVFNQSGSTYPGQLSCAFLDYDGDNDMDLLATDEPDGSSPNYDVYRYRNNGGLLLRFGTPVISLPDDIVAIKSGDMDNDGDDDIVLMTRDNGLNIGQSSQNYVYYYRSEGNGSFTQVSNIPVVFLSRNLELFDIDNDNDLDIIYIFNDPNSTNGNSKIRVYKNSGSAVFTFYSDFGSSSVQVKNRDVAFGDLDGDGDADAFVANAGGDAQNRVWYNDGNGNFTIAFTGLGTSQSDAVELGDIDGDGDLDAVTANWDSAGNQQSQVWINNLIGTNTAPTTVGTIPNISQVENSTTNQTIDLTQYFADAEDGAVGLSYTVTTTDPSYFSTNISGTDLLVNFNSGFGGPNTVTIQAEDSGGLTTTQSFTVTVTQQQCTVPTNVSVSNISFFDADISWTGSADAADGYQWYVMAQGEVPNQGGATAVASGSAASGMTTASVTGLNFSTDYDVYVEALCSITSTSNLSALASFTTLSCQSPSNLATSNITDSSVTATWTASATAFDGYNWYLMNPGEVPGTDTALNSGVVTNTSVNVTGLTAATSYDLYIQSKCVTGSLGGAVDTFVSFTTTASCATPTDVSVTNITAATLDLSWTASADATNGYRWYILPSGSTDTTQAIETNVTTNTTVTGVNASNLAAGTSYDAYVVSRCSATVNSGLSLVESFTMPSSLPLIEISGPVSISETGGNLSINFTASQQATQNIDISLDFSGVATLNNDYSINGSIATIVSGSASTSFSIPITDDSQLEALENIIIDITGITNGIEDGVQQLEVLIEDNESSNISFTDSGQTLVTLATDVVLGEIDNNPGLDALFAKDNFSDRVFFNNGSGILSNSGQTLGIESVTFNMATGNFVGANNNDVVLAKGFTCSVLLNNGGNYTPSVNIGTGNTNVVVETADVDFDGLDDIIVGKVGEIEVYINDIIANNLVLDFSISQTLSLGANTSQVRDIKVSDFNQDGNLDIVTATTEFSYVFYGTAGGQFNTNAVTLPNATNALGVDVFDIDNNNFEDFVFAQASSSSPNQIVLNNGTNGFSLMPLTPTRAEISTDVSFVDLDNDSDMDIVFSNLSSNAFWENIGGVFADNGFNITNIALGSSALDVGDIDGDGDMDVIFANTGNSSSTSSRIWFNDLQTLSDNDFEIAGDIKLYPNPVEDHFTIDSQNNEVKKVEVFNVQGQLVKLFKSSESYNIQDLESGLYFVSITSNQAISTIKILKE